MIQCYCRKKTKLFMLDKSSKIFPRGSICNNNLYLINWQYSRRGFYCRKWNIDRSQQFWRLLPPFEFNQQQHDNDQLASTHTYHYDNNHSAARLSCTFFACMAYKKTSTYIFCCQRKKFLQCVIQAALGGGPTTCVRHVMRVVTKTSKVPT